jgi:hypothetical protein
MWGNGDGQGKWMYNWEWKGYWKQNKESHNTADMLADIEKQDVNAICLMKN